MSIYIDIIWFLNLLFDGSLLLLTAVILKRRIKFWRLVVGSLIGSSLVLLIVSPLASIVSNPLIKFLFSLIIIWAAFGYKRFSYFIKNLCTFYFATFVVGGGIIAFHYLLQKEVNINNGIFLTTSTGYGDPVSWLFVIIAFPSLWYFSRSQIDGIKSNKMKYEEIIDVTIVITNIKITIKGLIDSGNQLYDPISRSPVMIIDSTCLVEHVPAGIIELSKNVDMLMNEMTVDDPQWEKRLRLIPYRGVGQDHQILLAIKPDNISLRYENNWLDVNKGLIALNHVKLSSDDEYQCIVHPKMIQSSSVQSA
ncbi:sigma-E processing peptidase SpoIIGA [Cytobacillus sp. IB215665]|uniref:sigma-E processing peptidase SpoIIGA n=1 Tax=Cytobacillus sp. IB215665 TaxID=3097357 RepID=UPI002A1242FE|nr:sigma-E processing peptidase SpoIIGA [Cytobacillus sp. IB215665]MDX8364980.1 sigma-E processing peptidase SpoIIGA [Cytobacillus sp. IB215665]